MSYLVLYHKNCNDGLAAAVAARQWLWDSRRMSGAKFTTMQYGDEAPDVSGFDVVIVDFSFPREVMLKLHRQANSLVCIDHHQTAQAELEGLDFCIFDMNKSGAVLAWEYFHPGKPLPKLMAYVQDRDLWRFELPFSEEISAALRGYKPFLEVWAQFLDDAAIAKLVGEGAPVVAYQKRALEMALSNEPAWVEIGGHRVPCVNATHLISELGNRLLQKYSDAPFAALYFDTADKRVFSLRSEDNRVDVSVVAQWFGGGGHRNAAGFSVDKPAVMPSPPTPLPGGEGG